MKIISIPSGIAAGDAGCKDGPPIILEQWQKKYGGNDIEFVVVKPTCSCTDNVECVRLINTELSECTEAAKVEGKFPIIIGGDHSCAIGTWSGIASAYQSQGPIGLLWFDAHMDAHTFETSESHNIHGMPVAVLLGKGDARLTSIKMKTPKILPENLCLLGVRSYEQSERDFLDSQKVRIFYQKEIEKKGFLPVFQAARQHVLQNTVGYGISIDLDGIDPLDAPGVGVPAPQGVRKEDLYAAFQTIVTDPHLLAVTIV